MNFFVALYNRVVFTVMHDDGRCGSTRVQAVVA